MRAGLAAYRADDRSPGALPVTLVFLQEPKISQQSPVWVAPLFSYRHPLKII